MIEPPFDDSQPAVLDHRASTKNEPIAAPEFLADHAVLIGALLRRREHFTDPVLPAHLKRVSRPDGFRVGFSQMDVRARSRTGQDGEHGHTDGDNGQNQSERSQSDR